MSGLDVRHFQQLVIVPALQVLQLGSEEAAGELLLGTALQESGLRYLKQLGNGPALGVFQMEPATHDDIWDNFLVYRPYLTQRLDNVTNRRSAIIMSYHLVYAACMCRLQYYRVPVKLPVAGDIQGQAIYWKQHYNTPLGAGTIDEYLHNWSNRE